jgi:hypothetical protein
MTASKQAAAPSNNPTRASVPMRNPLSSKGERAAFLPALPRPRKLNQPHVDIPPVAKRRCADTCTITLAPILC